VPGRNQLGEIHVLVNSAGVLDNEGIAGHSDETWRYHFSVNVDSYEIWTKLKAEAKAELTHTRSE
jgi:NAD(P)-dependent dehydrogenase (short-subunit alcohol dehydrogenase family)